MHKGSRDPLKVCEREHILFLLSKSFADLSVDRPHVKHKMKEIEVEHVFLVIFVLSKNESFICLRDVWAA